MKKLIACLAAIVLVISLSASALAVGKTITPLYPTTDIYHLEDRFVTTNIELAEGSNSIAVFTLFERERFASSAIRNAMEGDVIVTDGEEITIVSISSDGPDFVFNRDTETEMLFCDTGEGTFERVCENDRVPELRP